MILYSNLRQLYSMLDRSRKASIKLVIFLMIFTTILEMSSVGLVVPAIGWLLKGDQLSALSSSSVDQQGLYGDGVYFGLILLLFAFTLKGIFLIFSVRLQSKFVFNLKAYFSELLFENYLNESYDKIIRKNSSVMLKNITMETVALVDRALVPGFLVISEIFVVIGIGLVLLYLQPLATVFLFTALFLTMAFTVYKTKSMLTQWSRLRHQYESKRVQIAQESIRSIRDLFIFSAKDFFKKEYEKFNNKSADIEGNELSLQQYPKIFLEVIAVLLLAIMCTIEVRNGKSSIDVLTGLALFAAAAFRLMPSINRILNSLQSLRYSTAVIKNIVANVNIRSGSCSPDLDSDELFFMSNIKFDNVTYAYPGGEFSVLRDLSITINKNDCIGIVGVSGSGKSTLIDLLIGLIQPTHGSIRVDGVSISENISKWIAKIGYVPQKITLLDASIKNNVAFGVDDSKIDLKKLNAALQIASLNDFIESLPRGINEDVGEMGVRLSGGQIQRIGIARAIYKQPDILIFDEATSALDSQTEAEIMNSIQSLVGGSTIIIIAHRITTLKICNKIFRLENHALRHIDYSELA